jgi:hypothetical protein
MAVNNTRAYLRALALYAARTGVEPVASDKNIVQDIVQAILEEITDHFETKTGQSVETMISSTSGTTTTTQTYTGHTTTRAGLEQTS